MELLLSSFKIQLVAGELWKCVRNFDVSDLIFAKCLMNEEEANDEILV